MDGLQDTVPPGRGSRCPALRRLVPVGFGAEARILFVLSGPLVRRRGGGPAAVQAQPAGTHRPAGEDQCGPDAGAWGSPLGSLPALFPKGERPWMLLGKDRCMGAPCKSFRPNGKLEGTSFFLITQRIYHICSCTMIMTIQ